MNKERHSLYGQFVCFSGMGVIGTTAHYFVLIVMVKALSVSPIIASIEGFVVGALVNYLLNYYYTFHSSNRHCEAVTKFFLVALLGLLLNTSIMGVAIRTLHLHYLVAQVIATGLVLIWNFTSNRLWTFREGSHATK